MRHKTSQHLFEYWNRLRGHRIAPRRFEIEPASIGDALPDTFILERQDAGTFPFRLAGTRLCERFKKEFRGHNFLAAWSAEDRGTLRSRLNTVSVQGGVVLLLAEAETKSGKAIRVEILILPLLHGQGCADRFLGVVSPLDVPSWLGSSHSTACIWWSTTSSGLTATLDRLPTRSRKPRTARRRSCLVCGSRASCAPTGVSSASSTVGSATADTSRFVAITALLGCFIDVSCPTFEDLLAFIKKLRPIVTVRLPGSAHDRCV